MNFDSSRIMHFDLSVWGFPLLHLTRQLGMIRAIRGFCDGDKLAFVGDIRSPRLTLREALVAYALMKVPITILALSFAAPFLLMAQSNSKPSQINLNSKVERSTSASERTTQFRQKLNQRNEAKPQRGARFDHYRIETTGYDPVNSYLTMLASEYCSWGPFGANTKLDFQTRSRNRYLDWGFSVVEHLEYSSTDTQGLVAANNDMVLVVFRGSELNRGNYKEQAIGPLTAHVPPEIFEPAFKDWVLSDGNYRQIRGGAAFSGNNIKLHSGFATAALGILPNLKDALNKHRIGGPPGSRKPIVVTGHSLGAAMATLCSYHLIQEGYNVKEVYLHAAPMVGNLGFAMAMRQKGLPVYRTVYQSDIVPECPPYLVDALNVITRQRLISLAPQPYQHVSANELVYFDQERRARSGSDLSVAFYKRDRGPILNFDDHSMRLYTLALRQQIPNDQILAFPPE